MHLIPTVNDERILNIHERVKRWPSGLKLFLMSLPCIIFIFAFNFVPLFGWFYAFTNYKPGLQLADIHFTGLTSFINIFKGDDELLTVLRNTMVMSFISIITSPLAVIFAVFLNEVRNSKFQKLVQTTTTLPNFISWIIVYSLCFSIFSTDGMMNNLLNLLHLPVPKTSILSNDNAVWFFQWALATWKNLGWGAIIYIAGIAGIDVQLYDAAKIDGANRIQTIVSVTLPGLVDTYMVLLLLGIGNILSNGFDQYFVFYNALVADKIQVLDYYVYKVGIMLNNYPLSTAIGILKTFISLALLFTANVISKKLRGNTII